MNEKFKQNQISKFLSPSLNSQQSQSSKPELTTPNLPRQKSKIKFENLNTTIMSQPSVNEIKKNNPSTSSKYFHPETELKPFKCPICCMDLTDLNELNRQHHVDQCLPIDENKPTEHQNNKTFKCPICNEDLNEIDETKCQQHVNQCLDKGKSSKQTKKDKSEVIAEESKMNNAEMLENAVPSCPICGKTFQSLNTRQNHMKKCAKTFHIKTESLVELVKKQQDNLERDLARGIIPTGVYFIKKKKEKVEKPKKSSSTAPSTSEGSNQTVIVLPDQEDKNSGKLKITTKKNSKNQKFANTVLQTTTDEQRKLSLENRFKLILKNKIKYTEKIENTSFLIDTKFSNSKNYLWDKCKYFQENEESFYVKIFLDSGKFLVGNQVFIDKPTQGRYSNVELLNTQTAFLLAELNEQTQENITLNCTQFDPNKTKFNYSQFNKTNQAEEESFANKSTQFIKESYWQPEFTQKYSQFEPVPIFSENNNNNNNQDESFSTKNVDTNESLHSNQSNNSNQMSLDNIETNISDPCNKQSDNQETSFNKDQINQADEDMETESKEQVVSHVKNMFLDITCTETVKTKTPEKNDHCIIIDETIMSSSSSSSSNQNDQDISLSSHNSFGSKNSNILDQNLDTLEELDSDDLDNKENVIVLSNEEEKSEDLMNYSKKRRKSIEEVYLDEHLNESIVNESKRFKQNNNNSNLNVQPLKKTELISVDDKDDVVDPVDSDSCEIIEEINKKTINDDDNQVQVLKMIEKSFNQTRNIDDKENDNALDAVWNNFEENQFEDFYSYDPVNNEPYTVNNCSITNTDKVVENEIISLVENEQSDDSLPDVINYDEEAELLNHSNNQSFNHSNKAVSENEENEPEIEMKSPVHIPVTKKISKPKKNKDIETPINKQISRLRSNNEQLNITPLPEYEKMDTPNIKNELKRFGIKPLSKKQAVKKLVEIYEFTHRDKLKRSVSCQNLVETSAPQTSSSSYEIENAARVMNLEKEANTKKTKSKSIKKTVSDIGFQKNVFIEPEPPGPCSSNGVKATAAATTTKSLIKIGSKKKNKLLEKTIDDHMLAIANEDDDSDTDSESCSQLSTQQKATKKKKTIEENELNDLFDEFILNNESMYLDVLNYVPLDYENLYSQLQASVAPRKVNNKILMKILDEYCITFTLKSLNTRGNLNKAKNDKKTKK